MLRWGFPAPAGVPGSRVVTNVRNLASSYWRAWMRPEWRCLVPATAFCEYAPGKPAVPYWFATGAERGLFAFAGLWRPWHGTRGTKADPATGEHALFAFLTCAPNGVVAPIHAKAMPVVLTTAAEYEAWLEAPAAEALQLQRPLPDEALTVVASGVRQEQLSFI